MHMYNSNSDIEVCFIRKIDGQKKNKIYTALVYCEFVTKIFLVKSIAWNGSLAYHFDHNIFRFGDIYNRNGSQEQEEETSTECVHCSGDDFKRQRCSINKSISSVQHRESPYDGSVYSSSYERSSLLFNSACLSRASAHDADTTSLHQSWSTSAADPSCEFICASRRGFPSISLKFFAYPIFLNYFIF